MNYQIIGANAGLAPIKKFGPCQTFGRSFLDQCLYQQWLGSYHQAQELPV